MPEATFLCIDTSDHMRNGDYFPSRMLAVQEAANLLINSKMQQNPENTIGFLTMGGKACGVRETLTADTDRVMAALTQITVGGSAAHVFNALQIAALALSHCNNSRAEKRIIAFLGSPVTETPAQLEKLAKKLRKDEVAVDLISFGVPGDVDLLQHFIASVSKDGNSHFLSIPSGASIVDTVLSSAITLGDDAAARGGGGAGGAAGGGGFGGADPSEDAQLQMVIRMSMEEERLRQAAAAGGAAPAASAAADAAPREMTAEEEFELAMRMSEMEANGGAATGPTASTSGAPAASAAPRLDEQFQAAMADEAFMRQLAQELGVPAAADPAAKTGDGAPPPPPPPPAGPSSGGDASGDAAAPSK